MAWHGVIEKYKDFLPVTKKTPVVSLNEGNTPLIFAKNLSETIGRDIKIFLKYEGLNPTGSFKDRGMTMAISKALEEGRKAVMCASTGNTSASAAAYSARAKLRCIVLIPEGAIALGKLAQALIHGAEVVAIKGNFDDAFKLVVEITSKYPVALVNSVNPYRIEGQKTGAFEICDHLGGIAPDYHAIPVGNAGNITAYWKGYKEYHSKGIIKNLPKMIGFQAEGAAPIVRDKVVEDPKTIATAIKIGNPASWKSAVRAAKDSDGLIDMVSDDEILSTYKLLADKEGVFVEPASAASVAGVIKKAKANLFKEGSRIVCILTGHGLKDPERAVGSVKKPKSVDKDLKAVLKTVGF